MVDSWRHDTLAELAKSPLIHATRASGIIPSSKNAPKIKHRKIFSTVLKQIGRGKRFPLFTLLIYESIKTVTFMGTGTDWMNEHSKLRWIIGKKHLIEITTKWNSHNSLLLSKSKTIPRIEHNSTNPNYTSQNLKQFPESKNSSRTPKTLPRIWNIRGFWKYLTWLFPD